MMVSSSYLRLLMCLTLIFTYNLLFSGVTFLMIDFEYRLKSVANAALSCSFHNFQPLCITRRSSHCGFHVTGFDELGKMCRCYHSFLCLSPSCHTVHFNIALIFPVYSLEKYIFILLTSSIAPTAFAVLLLSAMSMVLPEIYLTSLL